MSDARSDGTADWGEAKEACVKLGGKLASIHNKTKQTEMENYFANKQTMCYKPETVRALSGEPVTGNPSISLIYNFIIYSGPFIKSLYTF